MSFDLKLYEHLRFCIRCGEYFLWCSVCRNFQDLINIYSGIPSSSLWHLVRHLPDIPFWHLTWQLIWHRIWLTIHIVWPRSWHLISFLKILHANILRVIKGDETSDIWPDIPVGISSDILLWHTFWRLSLRRIYLKFHLSYIPSGIESNICSGIASDVLSDMKSEITSDIKSDISSQSASHLVKQSTILALLLTSYLTWRSDMTSGWDTGIKGGGEGRGAEAASYCEVRWGKKW